MSKTLISSLSKKIMALAFVLLSFDVYAQEITAIDFSGNVVGKIIPDGKVISIDNKIIGSVTADSWVLDSDGKLIGGVVPSGIAIGNDTKILGKVDSDGNVRDFSGQVVGKTLPSGLVIDEYFNILGQVVFSGLVYNNDGDIAGRITGDGSYSSLNGDRIGIVTPDGYAYRKVGKDYVLEGRLISSRMVVSNNGNFLGSVVPDGKVTDIHSEIIGNIRANEYVYDNKKNVIGKIINKGYAFDDNGRYLGLISYNGTVIRDKATIGKIRADGRIINGSGQINGFMQSVSATAVDTKGHYLGRLNPQGQIVKDADAIGTLGAKGQVFSKEGNLIGYLVHTGPVYDYKGEHIGHAVSNGKVILLNGSEVGYMIGNTAYNSDGLAVGAVLTDPFVYDNAGNFLGICGISSQMNYNGTNLKISPLGYVFGPKGKVVGRTSANNSFYSVDGNIHSYTNFNGGATSVNGIDVNKIMGGAIVVNPQNKVVAQKVNALAAVNGEGETLGYPNQSNDVLDSAFKPVGKILPDGSVTTFGSTNYIPKKGQAYQNKIAVNFNGDLIGYVNTNGDIIGANGDKKGRLLERGLVEDNQSNIIGSILEYTGVKDEKCKLLGIVSQQGNVYSHRGAFVGKTLSNYGVINESGDVVGQAVRQAPVINYNGKIMGYTDYTGTVEGLNGETLGCIDNQERLYNDKGEMTGRLINYGSIIGFDGKIIGSVLFDGGFIDEKNTIAGYQQPDGNANSTKGEPVGMVMLYKIAFNLDDKFIGYIDNQGKVLGSNKKSIGKVDFDGNIYSGSELIGYALNDFYVYGQDGKLKGIIDKSGEVSDFHGTGLGYLDRGFVVKNGEVTARGNRDYFVRNPQKQVVGELQIDGQVIDKQGGVAGTINDKGEIKDKTGKIIAQATPLQYYHSAQIKDKKALNVSEKATETLKAILDENGNVTSYVMPDGTIVDPQGNVIGKVDENGAVKAILDENGNVISYVKADGTVVDAQGNVIGKLGSDGNIYDQNNQVVGKLNADGSLVDAQGKVIGKVDEKGTVKAILDKDGNVISYVKADGAVVDAKGNVIGKIDNQDDTKIIYDEKGNIVGYVKSDGTVLDAQGKVIGKLGSDGNIYDENGNVVGKIDENGNFLDAQGNVIGKIDNQGNPTVILDDEGNVVGYVSPDGTVLDAQGSIIGRADEDGNLYDENNNVIGHVDADGAIINQKGEIIGYKKKLNEINSDVMRQLQRNWLNKTAISAKKEDDDISKNIVLNSGNQYYQSLGIALTPDGEYLGEILDNNEVVDENNDVIGYRMPDGLIIDDKGNLIGVEDTADVDKQTIADLNDNKKNVFVPVGTFGPGGSYGTGVGAAGNLGPGGGYGPGERYDPARQAALNAAMNERRKGISVGKISSGIRKEAFTGYQKDWGTGKTISTWRVDMSEMILAGKAIPAVIARAIDTDNPAPIVAYVERNVYAEEGRNVIIPAGSRLLGQLGVMGSTRENTSDAARVQISWERLIRPDGSMFEVNSTTADAQGRGGALGYVDQQLLKKYTLPALTTVLTSSVAYMMATDKKNDGDSENSRQQAANDARENFLNNMQTMFDEILADKTNIKAMTYVPNGTRIIVYNNQDLWLRSLDNDQEESETQGQFKGLIDKDVTHTAANLPTGAQTYGPGGPTSTLGGDSNSGDVVYNPDKVNMNVSGSTAPLIGNTQAPKKSAPPPPPMYSAGVSNEYSASQDTSAQNASSSDSVPSLF